MKYIILIVLVLCLSCEKPIHIDCNAIFEIKNEAIDDIKFMALHSQYDTLLGQTAYNSKFTSLSGAHTELYEGKGKVSVINFWFIGCQPCMAEMPFFIELKNVYDQKDVVFYSVARNKAEALEKYIVKSAFNWPVYLADDVRYEYCVSSYPTTIVLDKDMKVVYYKVGGSLEKDQIADHIDLLRSKIDVALAN